MHSVLQHGNSSISDSLHSESAVMNCGSVLWIGRVERLLFETSLKASMNDIPFFRAIYRLAMHGASDWPISPDMRTLPNYNNMNLRLRKTFRLG